MVRGRLNRESNPAPGTRPGFTPQHDSTGSGDYVNTSPQNPLPVNDGSVEGRLQAIENKLDSVIENGAVNSQLTGSIVDNDTLKVSLDELVKIDAPVGYKWRNHPLKDKLFYNEKEDEFIVTDFDMTEFDPHKYNENAVTYYVDPINGNNSNDGLTKETALRDGYSAITKSDVDIIIILNNGGRKDAFKSDLTVDRDITIKADTPGILVSTHEKNEDLGWTKTTDRTNTYETSMHSGEQTSVFDSSYIDDYGDYRELKEQSTVEDVDANAGSYAIVDDFLYVHLHDSRPPDDKLKVFLDTGGLRISSSSRSKIYIEGIHFEGGRALSLTGFSEVYLNNIKSKYASNSMNGGLQSLNNDLVISNESEIARNIKDGFNYHSNDRIETKAIEINCIGRHNGSSGDTDNGSTMHDGGKIIRINGAYFKNKGPNVADVNDNMQSWNLGTVAHASTATMEEQNTDFMASNGSAEMWLDKCVGYGSVNSVNAKVAEAKIYKRDGKLSTESATGKIYEY